MSEAAAGTRPPAGELGLRVFGLRREPLCGQGRLACAGKAPSGERQTGGGMRGRRGEGARMRGGIAQLRTWKSSRGGEALRPPWDFMLWAATSLGGPVSPSEK